MLITNKHLEGACQDQVELFNKTFPVGAEFNKTNWDLALAVGLQVIWMERFLYESNRKIYDEARAPALKIYDEATAPARKIFNETIASYLKKYNEAEALLWKIYDEARAAALKIYAEEIAPALKIYYEATAPALKIYDEAFAAELFNALEQQFNGVK